MHSPYLLIIILVVFIVKPNVAFQCYDFYQGLSTTQLTDPSSINSIDSKLSECFTNVTHCRVRMKNTDGLIYITAGCAGEMHKHKSNGTFDCHPQIPDASSDTVCYCFSDLCNTVQASLHETNEFVAKLNSQRNGQLSNFTTELSVTSTAPNPMSFECFSSKDGDRLKRIECRSKSCTFNHQKKNGRTITNYGCLEFTWTISDDGCREDAGIYSCICPTSLCNTVEWAESKINSNHGKKPFSCLDYSDNTIDTTVKTVSCLGPLQCTSYLQRINKNEELFEGGCLDGLKHDALYAEDCYFDKDYIGGPLFVCYCSKPNCNTLTNFEHLATKHNANAWAEDAYVEVKSEGDIHRLSVWFILFQIFASRL